MSTIIQPDDESAAAHRSETGVRASVEDLGELFDRGVIAVAMLERDFETARLSVHSGLTEQSRRTAVEVLGLMLCEDAARGRVDGTPGERIEAAFARYRGRPCPRGLSALDRAQLNFDQATQALCSIVGSLQALAGMPRELTGADLAAAVERATDAALEVTER